MWPSVMLWRMRPTGIFAAHQVTQRRGIEQRARRLGTRRPPDARASIQRRPATSMLMLSVRTTCSTRKLRPDAFERIDCIAQVCGARGERRRVDGPGRRAHQHIERTRRVPGGSHSASARSTPTWYAPRAPPPARTSASRSSIEEVIGAGVCRRRATGVAVDHAAQGLADTGSPGISMAVCGRPFSMPGVRSSDVDVATVRDALPLSFGPGYSAV